MVIPGSLPQFGAMKTSHSLPWIFWVASAACSAQPLTIRLYDYADLSVKETARLVDTTDLVFSHAAIHVAWVYSRG